VLNDSFLFVDDHRVIIDLSDWESASDAENEEDENKDPGVSAANTADSTY